jgi:hypothetical protein
MDNNNVTYEIKSAASNGFEFAPLPARRAYNLEGRA